MTNHVLDPLLRPHSLAIIGASDRPDSNGQAMVEMSRIDGYEGRVYLINPRLEMLDGERCYPDLAALPEVPEHVIIGVASRFVEDVLDQAIALGVTSATIFAACYLDGDTNPPLPQRITEKARAANMAICGANCMGFYVPLIGLRVASGASPAGIRRGGIAWIAQSGSAFGALPHNDRRLGFTLCVSTGMELVTSVPDYMDWALAQAETRVIGLFVETIRDPVRFLQALALARDKGIPVVVLKVGRTARSAQMAVSHTGALVGNDAVYDAVFRAYGVHRVSDMDEMAATLAMFDTPRRIASGHLGTIHDSGGERELVVDMAEEIGLDFAALEAETCATLAQHLEPGLVPENPLDAYGTHNDLVNRYTALTATLTNDPNVAMALFMSNPRDGYAYAHNYSEAVKRAGAMTPKPLALVSSYSMVDDHLLAQSLIEAGIPLLRGTRNALKAAAHMIADRDFRARHSNNLGPNHSGLNHSGPESVIIQKWQARFDQSTDINEREGMQMLAEFGLSTPASAPVNKSDDLALALADLRFPLALKTAEDYAHKSDVGGVKLHLKDHAQAVEAYHEMASRLGPRALFMEMVPSGVELAIGAVRDAGFGTVVLLSAGGVLIELLDDKVAALAPFDQVTALGLIGELRIAKLLGGYRGQPAADLNALAHQISAFSHMAASLGDAISEIDVNPVICSDGGAFVADCLIVRGITK